MTPDRMSYSAVLEACRHQTLAFTKPLMSLESEHERD
jgi:hypothetical protein